MSSSTYDILIVGAGPAGSALAYALAARQSNKHHAPLRIVLIERSFSKPDRISGEFIQPSGVAALKKLGLESCLESIDTVPHVGLYLKREEQIICAPFPEGKVGPSIEHGAFVMALRDRVRQLPNVEMIEATVTGLIEDQYTHRVIGVHASYDDGKPQTHLADLVVVADGSQSKFRTQLLGQLSYDLSPQGYYVGFPVRNLPIPSGYLMYYAVKGARTVILYEIPHQGYRAMFELRHPPPADVKEHIIHTIIPQLPSSVRTPLLNALETERTRRVPHFYLPAAMQGKSTKAGALLIGDSLHIRHPLTGSGQTCALHDVVVLSDLLANVKNFGDWSEVSAVLPKWHQMRKPLTSGLSILSGCLAMILAGEGSVFAMLQIGAFNYLERDPVAVDWLMSLALGTKYSLILLARFCLGIITYSISALFTQPQPGHKSAPPVYEYPLLLVKALNIVLTSAIVLVPVIWAQI